MAGRWVNRLLEGPREGQFGLNSIRVLVISVQGELVDSICAELKVLAGAQAVALMQVAEISRVSPHGPIGRC